MKQEAVILPASDMYREIRAKWERHKTAGDLQKTFFSPLFFFLFLFSVHIHVVLTFLTQKKLQESPAVPCLSDGSPEPSCLDVSHLSLFPDGFCSPQMFGYLIHLKGDCETLSIFKYPAL